MSKVTVLMYHDVRKAGDFFPKRYRMSSFLDPTGFQKQIRYIKAHYTVLTVLDFLHFLQEEKRPPENSALLTFDDGLLDHYFSVLPILQEYQLPAVFFIPSQPIQECVVIDNHKIQFVLAGAPSEAEVAQAIIQYLQPKDECRLWKQYSQSLWGQKNEWPPERVFVTNFLRRGMPLSERRELVSTLFQKYVTKDEKALVNQLYLKRHHIQEMANLGMVFGGHGHASFELGQENKQIQEKDILTNHAFLKSLFPNQAHFYFSYPSGGYDKDTLAILQRLACALAFTTRDQWITNFQKYLELPRWDAPKFLRGVVS